MYIFSGLIWRAVEKGKESIMKKLSDFCQEICLELIQHEVPEERGARVCSQLLGSATNKLNEMIAELKQLVTEKQREISRIITPHIQVCMTRLDRVLSGRVLDSRPGGCGFELHRRHCVVSLSKTH